MFSEIMKAVLEEMEKNAREFEEDKAELSPYEHVREFRTVHLNYGRRTGKTKYINSSVTEDDLILIPRLDFCTLYKGKNIGSSQVLLNKNLPTFKTIYVDEPKLHTKLDDCLKKLIKNHDQTVIMVGG